jgi:flagellar basal-body rod protein FlgF
MNVGLYQSASALSALERWQDVVSQNITSSQTTGYRKRAASFSTHAAGEIQNPSAPGHRGRGPVSPLYPKFESGISFVSGETQPTHRELDVAIQGEGFFEVKGPAGDLRYTRNGEFRVRADRTLTTAGGHEVMGEGGAPVTLLPDAGRVSINQDGGVFQGGTELGRLAVKRFADPSRLAPVGEGFFQPTAGSTPAVPVDAPELLQGYLESSNVAPLREMVDLVLISRAYEANQRIITSADEQMQKTLDALG